MADSPEGTVIHLRIPEPLLAAFDRARSETATPLRAQLSRAAFLRSLIERAVSEVRQRGRPRRRARARGGRA